MNPENSKLPPTPPPFEGNASAPSISPPGPPPVPPPFDAPPDTQASHNAEFKSSQPEGTPESPFHRFDLYGPPRAFEVLVLGAMYPIIVPPDWSREEDIREYLEDLGEEYPKDIEGRIETAYQDMRARIEAANQELCDVLDSALEYFIKKRGQSSPVPLAGCPYQKRLSGFSR